MRLLVERAREEGGRGVEGEGEGEGEIAGAGKGEGEGDEEGGMGDLAQREEDNVEGEEEIQAETYIWVAPVEELEDGEWDFGVFVREKMGRWVGEGAAEADEGFKGEWLFFFLSTQGHVRTCVD